MKITVDYDLNSYEAASVIKPRQMYRIKQDDEIDPSLYTRPGYDRPMVFRLHTHGTMPMTRTIQEFLFSLNRSDNEGRDRGVFSELYDTWATNYAKIRVNANYITGERLEMSLPKWTNLVIGRNVICGTEMVSDGSHEIGYGIPILKVETLDPDNLPFGINPIGNEHVIHHCSVITSATYNDMRKVNPFIQMGGKIFPPYLPTRYALMSRVDVFIEMWMLEKLPLGSALPNPYNPAWG